MADVKEFKALFTLNDQCSKPLKELHKSFKAFAASANKFRKNATSLAAVSLAPLAGAVAAVGASLKNSLNVFLEYGTGLNDTAYKLGITSKQLVSLQHAADMAGSSSEAMSAGLAVFSKNLALAGQGRNKELVAMFNKLGISMRDANGHMRTTAELMPELADAMKRQQTQAQKTYIANMAFGKSGQELIQTLDGGSEALKTAADEAERLGLVMEDSEAVSRLDDSFKLLQLSIKGVQVTIGEKLEPVLRPIIESMTQWIMLNRKWLAQEFASMVQDLAASLKEVDFKSLITGFTSFLKVSVQVFKAVGGLKTVAAIVATLFGAKVAASVFTLTTSMFGLLKAFGVLVPSLITGIKAVGVAFLTNPIGLVLAGIAAAVGLLYYYWDDVAPFFNRLKDALIGTFSDLWSKFKAIWDDLCALASAFFSGDWGEFAQRLGSLFSDALSALKSIFFLPFTLQWDAFKSAFPQAAESIKSAFENIKAYFADAVAGIKSAITPLIDFFAGLWGAIKSAFFDNFIKAMDGVRNAASWVGDKFSGAISGVKSFFGSSDESAPKNVSALPAPVSQGITSANPQGKIEVLVRTDEGAKAEVVDQHSNPGLTLSPHTENGRLR